MCGISGFLTLRKYNASFYRDTLIKMSNELENRGPDAQGIWYDELNGIGFSHRRLSILDLSETGDQPMRSSNGRYMIVFNGEIYNHHRIREDLSLSGNIIQWNGTSDTETLLKAIEVFGLANALERCRGMFALALWDEEESKLSLARDRVGEKPLYYGVQNGELLFSSQINSLKVYPYFSASISSNATIQYLKYGFVPAPLSIFNDIFKLLPGQILNVCGKTLQFDFETYWSLENAVIEAKANPFSGSFEDASIKLDELIVDAVNQQMISDVPLGAFLSGGIDSSTIVGIMQSISSKKVKTFSIGFDEKGFNEAIYAKAVSEYLGTEHHEVYLTPKDTLKIVPDLPDYFDEPFSDSSQIPTYLLAKITKKEVTVALSGDGGDELFCGYNRYLATNRYWSYLSKLPIGSRFVIEKIYSSLPKKNILFESQGFRRKLDKASTVLQSRDLDELYFKILSKNQQPEEFLLNPGSYSTDKIVKSLEYNLTDIERMMFMDFKSYLVDDILVKVDRCSMAVSLETRVPFLDHEIIEFAWSLPESYKIRGARGKLVLRDVLKKYVPDALIERPKKGFGIPLDAWLRGPLVDWVETFINRDFLDRQKIFRTDILLNIWMEHKSGKRNYGESIWNILMFQAWYYKNFEKK
jgi:asparagine synthase (glutamine-hydrolysing)